MANDKMGDLSEHFNHKDFACRCEECKGKNYRIHLGLVGALEMIGAHFKKPVKIVSGYRCEESSEKVLGTKKSFHTQGKAANIFIEGISPAELFKFVEQIPEIKGLGFYPQEKFVHLDTRDGEKVEWVKESGAYLPLTPERKRKYGLEVS